VASAGGADAGAANGIDASFDQPCGFQIGTGHDERRAIFECIRVTATVNSFHTKTESRFEAHVPDAKPQSDRVFWSGD